VICGTLQTTAATIKYSLLSIIVTINQCSDNLLASPSRLDYFPCCAAGITAELVPEQHHAVNSVTLRLTKGEKKRSGTSEKFVPHHKRNRKVLV